MDLEVIKTYIERRLNELEDMIALYNEAGQDAPIDLLARRQEVERLESRLKEYEEVQNL